MDRGIWRCAAENAAAGSAWRIDPSGLRGKLILRAYLAPTRIVLRKTTSEQYHFAFYHFA